MKCFDFRLYSILYLGLFPYLSVSLGPSPNFCIRPNSKGLSTVIPSHRVSYIIPLIQFKLLPCCAVFFLPSVLARLTILTEKRSRPFGLAFRNRTFFSLASFWRRKQKAKRTDALRAWKLCFHMDVEMMHESNYVTALYTK